MLSIIRASSIALGGLIIFQAWLITLLLAAALTPITFFLAILVGIPAYLLSSASREGSANVMEQVNAFASWPIRQASAIMNNLSVRFHSISTGKAAEKRAEMLALIRSGGRSAAEMAAIRKLKIQEDTASVMVAAAIVIDITVAIIIGITT
jgi:hypothetical protein